MKILFRLSSPGQQLLLASPLSRSHQRNRQLALALLRFNVSHRRRQRRRARHVRQEDVHHVPDTGVGVAEPIGLVAWVHGPAHHRRRGRHDEEPGILLEQEGEVAHNQLAEGVELEEVCGGRLGRNGHEDLVCRADEG